jgi:hypothetical protein
MADQCPCHDQYKVAQALMGLRIGGVPITWDEACSLARQFIVRIHGKG